MSEFNPKSELFPQSNWHISESEPSPESESESKTFTFTFKGLVEVDFVEGAVYCIIDIDEVAVKNRYMSLSFIFEQWFKGVEPRTSPDRVGNQYENVTITISQAHDAT